MIDLYSRYVKEEGKEPLEEVSEEGK